MLAAHIEIFAHAHLAEQIASLCTLHDTIADNPRGWNPRQRRPLPQNISLIRQKAANGVKQRRLTGAVNADHGDEFSLMHMQRYLLERLSLVIEHAEILHVEQGLFAIREA